MVKRLSSSGSAGVVSMSLHPSHRALLTSGSDGVVRMWDMVRGVEATRRRVKFEHPSVTAGGSGQAREEVRVAWEEAGHGYAMVCGKVLTVYDEQGAVRRVVHADSRVLSSHFIAPSLLVAGCDDCSLRCWDAQTGEQLWVQKQHSARVRCLDYLRLPDEQLLIVSASTDGQLCVWRGSSEGGVRAGVERVAGAKSEARITALCCGVKWDARRPPHKVPDPSTAAAHTGFDESTTVGEEEEITTAAAHGASHGRTKRVANGKGARTNGHAHAAAGKKQLQPRTATSTKAAATKESRAEIGRGEADERGEQNKRRKQADKQQHEGSGAVRGGSIQQASTKGKSAQKQSTHGKAARGNRTKVAKQASIEPGMTVTNHKRRAR